MDASSYRIVQEALTNTMKHAGPGARAQVVVSYGSDELRLEASDNGAGEPAHDGTGNSAGEPAHDGTGNGAGEPASDGTGKGAGEPAHDGTGNGLRGMRERAVLLGGDVAAGPGPDGGYVVRARIPLDPGETA